MADLTITAANVVPGSGAKKQIGVAGAALTIGLAVYKKSSDKRWYASDADTAEADALEYGITVSQAAAAGQPVVVQYAGNLAFGAILTSGAFYTVGEAAGGIAPYADVEATEYARILGQATSTSNLRVHPFTTNTVHG